MGGGDPRSGPPASHGVCRQVYPPLSSFSFYCLTSVTEFFLLGRGSWCSTGNEITPGQLGTFGRLLPPGSGNWRLWGLTPLWRGGVGKTPGSHCVLELSSCSRPLPQQPWEAAWPPTHSRGWVQAEKGSGAMWDCEPTLNYPSTHLQNLLGWKQAPAISNSASDPSCLEVV